MDSFLNFDPWYLTYPEEANNICHTEHYIKHGEKKNIRRKIFEEVEYDEFEKKCLLDFKHFIHEHKAEVPPKESSYLKMLQSGKYNMKKALAKVMTLLMKMKALKQHTDWINNSKMHTLDEKSAQFLQQGHVYLCGRDKMFRPVIYMDCEHINLKIVIHMTFFCPETSTLYVAYLNYLLQQQGAETITRAICVFLQMVKKNMFLGGKIENWIFIIDTKGKGIFDLPLKALGMIIDVMQVNFGGHLEKLFILNPSFGLSTTWSVIEKMIDEEAAQKIKFLKKKQLHLLQEVIAPRYLQNKYSGQLDDLTQFWPPVDIYTTEQQREDRRQKELKEAATTAAAAAAVAAVDVPAAEIQLQKEELVIIIEPAIAQFNPGEEPQPKIIREQEQTDSTVKVEAKMVCENIENPIIPQNLASTNEKDQEKTVELTAGPIDAQIKTDKGEVIQPPKAFEITISKVEDIRYEYSNNNQYNDELHPSTQQQSGPISERSAQPQAPVQSDQLKTEASQKEQTGTAEQKPVFQEIDMGKVFIFQEEIEEGAQIEGEDQTQFAKQQQKNFASKSSFVKEDMKMIEVTNLDSRPVAQGGCCGSSNQNCNIF